VATLEGKACLNKGDITRKARGDYNTARSSQKRKEVRVLERASEEAEKSGPGGSENATLVGRRLRDRKKKSEEDHDRGSDY